MIYTKTGKSDLDVSRIYMDIGDSSKDTNRWPVLEEENRKAIAKKSNIGGAVKAVELEFTQEEMDYLEECMPRMSQQVS